MPVALAALIAAYEHVDDREMLRAAMPLAGATVIEHQARRAIRAGASHIVVLVERLPTGLAMALDRLRRGGIRIDFAPSMGDAADRFHPDERILVLADGCIADQPTLDRVAAATVPSLLTVRDGAGRDGYERIDGLARWGGVALLDGVRLRDTAAMLGEWDPLSTLLRRAVQEGAQRVPVPENRAEDLPVFADSPTSGGLIEARLVADTRGMGGDWPARYLFPLIEDRALVPLFRRLLDPFWLAAGAALLAVIAAAVGIYSGGLALGLLLLSGPVASIAERLALIRAAALRYGPWLTLLRRLGAMAALFTSTAALAKVGGWGWWLVAGAIPAGMVALTAQRRLADHLNGWDARPWLASTDGLIWLFLPFAAAGYWGTGLATGALYALGSFGFVQWRMIRDMAREPAAPAPGRNGGRIDQR
jgi:hypothetical protein